MVLHRAFAALVALASFSTLAACASADGTDGVDADPSALGSSATTFVIPVDPRARALCRDEINQRYCSAAAARSAAAACLAKIGADDPEDACASGGAGCLRYETFAERCDAPGEVYPDAASCASPRPRSCVFYSACLEANTPCGDDGYALGYGERFCYAFKNTTFTPKGNTWRDSVMLCLQTALAPTLVSEERLSCDELHDFAFASHPDCYTRPEASICDLSPVRDLPKVFGTIGADEALKRSTLEQMRRVAAICLRKFVPFAGARGSAELAPRSFATSTDADELRASYEFWAAKAEELGVRP